MLVDCALALTLLSAIYHIQYTYPSFAIQTAIRQYRTWSRYMSLYIHNCYQGMSYWRWTTSRSLERRAKRRSSRLVARPEPIGKKASRRNKWAYQTWHSYPRLQTKLSTTTWWSDGRMEKSMQVVYYRHLYTWLLGLHFAIDIYWPCTYQCQSFPRFGYLHWHSTLGISRQELAWSKAAW